MLIGFLDLWSIRCCTKAYPPYLLGPSGGCGFGVDHPCRDSRPYFDILGFHHVFVRCHIEAYPPSYWDHLEFIGSV